MKKAKLFLIEIVEEYIYINIKENEKQPIIDLCRQILEREPDNAMANAALVVLSDDAFNINHFLLILRFGSRCLVSFFRIA